MFSGTFSLTDKVNLAVVSIPTLPVFVTSNLLLKRDPSNLSVKLESL
jgi:hypothetical protein